MFIVDIEIKKKNMKVNNKNNKSKKIKTLINGNNCHKEFPRTKDEK